MKLSRRQLLKGIGTAMIATLLPKKNAELTAPTDDVDPWEDIDQLAERLASLCALVRERDARFVSVQAVPYDKGNLYAIHGKLWSELRQAHCVARMDITSEVLDLMAHDYIADAMLAELEWLEGECS